LQSAIFLFSIKLSISQFVRRLPSIPAFNTLHANLPNHILAANDQDYGAFITLKETALELDTIFHSANQVSKIHRSQNTAPVVPSLPPVNTSKPVAVTPSSSTPNVMSTAGSSKLCSNCGRPGHWVTTCFEQGGGMEGRWADFRKNKHKVVAMLLASLEESCGYQEDERSAIILIMDASSSTTTPETLDDIILAHDMENPISSSIVALNQNLHRDVYAMCESIRPSSFIASTEFNHTAFLSLGGKFNACLDSGCMDYIITNRALFQNYDTKGAVKIGTANCGLLSAKGSGNVTFRLPFKDRYVFLTLRGCLHAPNAPINFILVGALNESQLMVTFQPDGPTSISYPLTDPELPGFTFFATVIRRISFLNLDFVPLTSITPQPHAFSMITFPKIKQSSTLWHR
jgi:hypothetical protein